MPVDTASDAVDALEGVITGAEPCLTDEEIGMIGEVIDYLQSGEDVDHQYIKRALADDPDGVAFVAVTEGEPFQMEVSGGLNPATLIGALIAGTARQQGLHPDDVLVDVGNAAHHIDTSSEWAAINEEVAE